jgi:hypothetical protein
VRHNDKNKRESDTSEHIGSDRGTKLLRDDVARGTAKKRRKVGGLRNDKAG